jgi:hypothetical protein
VYVPGVGNNYLSTPDAAALDITGDIDLRAYVAMDNWAPSAVSIWIGKYQLTDNQRSYSLGMNSSNGVQLRVSADGTTGIFAESTVALSIPNGVARWIRATRVAATGVCQFFTSTDGTTWTQLGTDVTVTSGNIFVSTTEIQIGAQTNIAIAQAQKIYRAQILDGIDGTTVLDVDTSVITTGAATSFTAVTGQTVSILRNTSGRKTVAVTQPTWLFGTDDYMEVNNRYMAHSGSNYLYLPGVASNYASTPDAAALDITGDIDLRVKVALDDWTPSAVNYLIAKYNTSNVSYSLRVNAAGTLSLAYSTDGTTAIVRNSSVVTGITDGATKWVRATLDVDNDDGGNDVKFFLSDDGTNWTQLGTTVTNVSTTSIFSGNAILEIGSFFGGTSGPARGKFFRAQVLDGIGGTVAFDADFETGITSLLQTTFTESSLNAATVTINRSGTAYRSAGITEAGYLYPGATNTFTASATDFLNFGESDSFTYLAIHRQWDTAAVGGIIGNRSIVAGTVEPGYFFAVSTQSGGVNRSYSGVSGPTAVASTDNTSAAVGWINGVLNTHVTTVNRSTNLISLTKNAGTAITASISTITTPITNVNVLRIGASSPVLSSYATMEFIGAAVFRTALTTAQIRQVVNYFTNREAYL